jgi:hypothetical protein
MKPEWVWHMTLNTGNTRKSYRGEVSDDVLAAMRQMDLLKSRAKLPIAGGYQLQTTIDQGGAAFTVFKGEVPLGHCVLAVDANDAAYWEFIERLYLNITDKAPVDWVLPDKPLSVPWLAVVLLGLHHDVESAQWLRDFERCMAWLLIEDVFCDQH